MGPPSWVGGWESFAARQLHLEEWQASPHQHELCENAAFGCSTRTPGDEKDDTVLQCLTLRHKNTYYSETLLIMTQFWYPACYKYNPSLDTPPPTESNNWDLEGTVREQLGIQQQPAEEDREPPPPLPPRPTAPRVCTYTLAGINSYSNQCCGSASHGCESGCGSRFDLSPWCGSGCGSWCWFLFLMLIRMRIRIRLFILCGSGSGS